MSMNDNIIITVSEDNKVYFKAKDYQKEVLKTQKSIQNMTKCYDKTLPALQKAKDKFCNKFGIAKSKIDILIDSKELRIMQEFAERKDTLGKIIQWETDYLEHLGKMENDD